MRVRTGLYSVSFCALSLVFCAAAMPQAQSAAAPPQTGQASSQDSANDVSVAAGKSVLVDFASPVQRVAVGQSDIAEATATSPTEIMVNGKAPGQTSLIVWQASGDRQFFSVTVRESTWEINDRLSAARRELSAELPGQDIKMSTANGSIFLRGTVKDLASSTRAVQIAATALPPPAAGGLGNLAAAGAAAPAASGVPGTQSAPGADTGTGKVINLLYVAVPPAEPQILLKVRFASIDLNKVRELGINLFSLGLGNTVGGITTGQFYPPSISGGGGTSGNSSNLGGSGYSATFSNELNLLAFFPGLKGGADIQASDVRNTVEVLAEPNVVAANGKQASFLAGGEYPYPVVQAGAAGVAPTITIMFKEYGVRLNFIPTITPRGTIRLQVAPEVSSLDFTDAVEISGFEVPAINVRRVKTEAELAEGETFVIGGLLDHRDTETFEKIPFLGDIPILGKFFQSKLTNKLNTELIVMVTPEIVKPIPVGAPTPELKFPSKFLPPISGIAANTPDAKTGETPAPPPTMPVEKLIESMAPEKPLMIEGTMSPVGSNTTNSSSSTQ